MTYLFQSRNRNHDLGKNVRFRNFEFSTSDEEVAAFVRRNCKAQPDSMWEVTPQDEEPKPDTDNPPQAPPPPRRPGRPKTVVNRGMRTAELAEGAQT